MMKLIYQVILAFITALVVWELVTQKDFKLQFMSAMALIPLVLRLAMIV